MEIVLLLIFFPKLVLAPIFLTRKFHFQNWHKKLAYINIKTKWFLNYKKMDRLLKSCPAFLPLFWKSPMGQWPVRKTRQNMRANRYMKQQVLKKLWRLDSNLGYSAQHRLVTESLTHSQQLASIGAVANVAVCGAFSSFNCKKDTHGSDGEGRRKCVESIVRSQEPLQKPFWRPSCFF